LWDNVTVAMVIILKGVFNLYILLYGNIALKLIYGLLCTCTLIQHSKIGDYLRSEILTATSLMITAFRDITQCSLE
jgi:hypothetical protein